MTDAILNITDGTTTISLINESSGFHLVNWVPAITDYKGGGVFQDPPLADWRQLRVAKWATAVENFGLTINGQNPDNAAYNLQELRRLLEKANAYWTTNWQNTPVYIEARAKCETNTRYCLVVKGRLANDQNYYRQPFTGSRTTMRDLPLIIERRAWLQNAPGTGTQIALSAVETYNGVDYGNVDSSEVRTPTTGKVYLANKRNEANITNIHLTTAGANRIGVAPPYDIINATGETYFGIDTSVSDSGPFSNLVFDIGTAGVGGPTLVFEYWNGATWQAFASLIDQTSNFTNTGVNIISWGQPANWATNSPGGGLPTGYWMRVMISAGSFSTEPTQQNRNVYSVVWPYIEIQSDAIGGDITALDQIKLYGDGCASELQINWFIIGLRSMPRGENFTAYLNAADEQNPSGVTVALGANTAYATSLHSSVGRVAQFTPPTDDTTFVDIVTWTIDNTLSDEYLGTYHVYLRMNIGGSGSPFIQTRIGIQFDATESPRTNYEIISVTSSGSSLGRIIDMGQIIISPKLFSSESVGEINIYASVAPINAGTDIVEIYDIILIPVDEWAGLFYSNKNDKGVIRSGLSQYLDIDSIHSKKVVSSTVRSETTDEKITNYQTIVNGPSVSQSSVRQRLWVLGKLLSSTSTANNTGEIESAFAVELFANQRYLSLRGER